MNETLMTVFTAVIAVSTVIYTIVTIKLWKATMSSVDVAKATVLMSYLTTLAQEVEKIKIDRVWLFWNDAPRLGI